MSESIYNIIEAKFSTLTNAANGGVISITRDIDLYVSVCSFYKCIASDGHDGGGIFFQSKKSFVSRNNCAIECSAGRGYLMHATGALKSKIVINLTMSTQCSGNEAIFFLFNSDLCSHEYNSTHCISFVRCNVHTFYNEVSDIKYHHFYKNKQDILLGANTASDKLVFSHVSLIMNEYSERCYGYIHGNSYASEVITVDNIYAYGNIHKVINPENGKIIVKSFYGDEFACTGNGVLITEAISISSGFVKTTEYKPNLICNRGKTKFTCIARRNEDHISFFLFLKDWSNIIFVEIYH